MRSVRVNMNSILIITTFVFGLHAICVHAQNVCQRNVAFDYIELAIQWAPGVCHANQKCRPYSEKWTIHGIWPTNNNGSFPEHCCYRRFFNISQLAPILSDMKTHWTSLTLNDTIFWKHEWQKHGTCAHISRSLEGQRNYFQKTLQLFKALKLNEWLRNASILAKPLNSNSEYKLENIRKAISLKTGKRPRFECRIIRKRSQLFTLLSGIYFCYERSALKLVDCSRNDDTDCGTNNVHFINNTT
ncbi:ribonuclease Oy-like protein [Leptotrombidium deliense]|uniref:Ribonuclease Oy-like protein n=1 Tax=Leptotrombidium deliense TaxID=299467 RepID=A0A443SVC0_9ACAR|nr:ribonuclease Oy-like protein [Leptotrombidium deliense]